MRKIIISGMIGNGLEWYDYALYGHCAAIIGRLFFPLGNEFISLIAAFGIFAAGFAMRPLGAIVFGYIGDRYGRKIALSASILLMAIPTTFIGLLPTYEQIGIAAPILLTVIRLLQGLSLGGEFSGSIIFVVEHAPFHRRGVVGCTSMLSMCIGILLGSATAVGVAELMPSTSFEVWGWRIPFLISVLIGAIGWYIRAHLHESPIYEKAKKEGGLSKTPIRETFQNHKMQMLIGVGIYLTVTVPFYILTVFMNTFFISFLKYPVGVSLTLNTFSMGLLTFLIPFAALLSDRIGRKPVLTLGAFAFVCLSLPIFWLFSQSNIYAIIAGLVIFASLVAFYIPTVPTVLVEIFPTSIRYTGLALSYNISAAVFGGTAPMVATWLINKTESNLSVGVYIMIYAAITLVILRFYKETYRVSLH